MMRWPQSHRLILILSLVQAQLHVSHHDPLPAFLHQVGRGIGEGSVDLG